MKTCYGKRKKRKLLKMTKILKNENVAKVNKLYKIPSLYFSSTKEICDLTKKKRKSHNDSRYFFCEIERRFCKVKQK